MNRVIILPLRLHGKREDATKAVESEMFELLAVRPAGHCPARALYHFPSSFSFPLPFLPSFLCPPLPSPPFLSFSFWPLWFACLSFSSPILPYLPLPHITLSLSPSHLPSSPLPSLPFPCFPSVPSPSLPHSPTLPLPLLPIPLPLLRPGLVLRLPPELRLAGE